MQLDMLCLKFGEKEGNKRGGDMFERLKDIVRKLVSKILKKDLIEKKVNVEVAISNEMEKNIELWLQLYEDKPPWLNEETQTMGLPAAISREIARLVTLELDTEVIGNDYLNEQYQSVIDNVRNYTEFACAQGGLVFKPYINQDEIAVDLVQADRFLPTSFDSKGKITGAVFTEFKQVGDELYTRLEQHNITDKGCYITNLAYVKENYNSSNTADFDLGKQISLKDIEDWSELEAEVIITNVDKPLFSYFKMPLANHIDRNSPLGVSVYSRVIKDLEEADKQYSRVLWEYEGSELAEFVSTDCFRKDSEGNPIIDHRKKRLYQTLDFETGEGTGTKPFETFSPEIRDSSLFNGLNQLLRKIEFKCGLAYGTISDAQDEAKTATEIKTSKQRSYSTVKDIQKALQSSLEDLVEIMHIYTKLYKLPSSNYEMSFNWDDSLVMDKDAELQGMLNDVNSGILKAEIYLMKKYGLESEEEARKMMPSYEPVSSTPFDNTVE